MNNFADRFNNTRDQHIKVNLRIGNTQISISFEFEVPHFTYLSDSRLTDAQIPKSRLSQSQRKKG